MRRKRLLKRFAGKQWSPCQPVEEGETFARVVWERKKSYPTNDADTVGFEDNDRVRGVHCGDPDYWCCKLEQDYNRDREDARLIYVMARKGDHFCEDPLIIDKTSTGDSGVLLTTRKVLKEGRDFERDDDWKCYCDEEEWGDRGY